MHIQLDTVPFSPPPPTHTRTWLQGERGDKSPPPHTHTRTWLQDKCIDTLPPTPHTHVPGCRVSGLIHPPHTYLAAG